MLPRYFFYLLTYVSLSFPTQGFGQQETQPLNDDGQDRGAIILVSVEGSVFVLKNDSGRPLPSTKVVTGAVLYESHTVVCGKDGKAVLLFSNGSTATLKSDTKLNLRRFRQDTFIATNEKLADLKMEPSVSETHIDLNFGNLVINVKKLDRASSFEIHSPIGTVGIRGTRVELKVRVGIRGGFSGRITVPEGMVTLTPLGFSDRPVAAPRLIPAGNSLELTLNTEGKATTNIVQTTARPTDLTGINAELDHVAEKTDNVRISQIVAAINAVAKTVPAIRVKQPDAKEAVPSNEKPDDNSDAPEDIESPVEKQASRDNAKDAALSKDIEANPMHATLKEIEKRLEKIKQQSLDIENVIGMTGSPKEVSYGYDIKTGILTVSFLDTNGQTTLKKHLLRDSDDSSKKITSENLKDSVHGVIPSKSDGIIAQTVPVLVEIFETVDSVNVHDRILSTSVPENFNEILGEAVRLGNDLLENVILTGKPNVATDFENNFYDAEKIKAMLYGNNSYYYELVKMLASNGAFGDSGDNKVTNAIDQLVTPIFPVGVSSNKITDLLEMTIAEVVETSGSDLGGLVNLSEFTETSLFQLPVANIQGIVGQKITLGENGKKTTIDLTDQLTPRSDTATAPEDWKIFGIGAGKDLIVKGDVTFKNSNRHSRSGNMVKDHALAIGALDDIHFHSKTWEQDWGLPSGFLQQHLKDMSGDIASDATTTTQTDVKNRVTVDFEGANLYIGSISKLQLVNVDLKSGGNIGVGSLDELHIVSLDPNRRNTFSVGTSTNSTEGDNLQLYANERIVTDGLAFNAGIDEIYLEARTIDLKNITFPAASEVTLASELGGISGRYPTFGNSQRQTGRVNFIQNVYYNVNHLDSEANFDSLDPLPNGKHPIVIKKR